MRRPLLPSLAAAPPSATLGSGALAPSRRAADAKQTEADGADGGDVLLEGVEEPGRAPRRQLAGKLGVAAGASRHMRRKYIESCKGRCEEEEGK